MGLYPGQNQWKLWKVVNGDFGSYQGATWMSGTPIASGSHSLNSGQYCTLAAVAQDSTLKLYIDGTPKYSFSDPSPYSYTNVGLRARDAKVYFDDVRVEGLTSGAATYYRFSDATGALMHELDQSGNVTVSYISDAAGRMVAVKRGTETYYYHYNAHGDVVALTDSGGYLVAKFSYDPWGNPSEFNASGAQVTLGSWAGTPGQGVFFLFGGMLYDVAAGLYLTKTRAYNPKTGRFLQRDVLDEAGKNGIYKGFPFGRDAVGTNLYAWCKNNPVSKIDPSGLDAMSDWFGNSEYGRWQRRQMHQDPPAGSAQAKRNTVQEGRDRRQAQRAYEIEQNWSRASGVKGRSYWEIKRDIERQRQAAEAKRAAEEAARQREIAMQNDLAAHASYARAGLDSVNSAAMNDGEIREAGASVVLSAIPGGNAAKVAGGLDLALNTNRFLDHTPSQGEWVRFGVDSSVALYGLLGGPYGYVVGLTYAGINFINARTADPRGWTCMLCHQNFRDEVKAGFGQ